MEVGDLRLARSKKMSTTRSTDLGKALEKIKPRLNNDEWKQLCGILTRVVTYRRARDCPPGALIKFGADMIQVESSSDDQEEMDIAIRKDTVWLNLSTQNRARESRIAQGHAANILEVDHFVAYTGNYTHDCADDLKQECGVGQILKTNQVDGVHVRR